jgi:pyruvate dehydrogenase E2 component (dihydrolipoamide acetyltransferase)
MTKGAAAAIVMPKLGLTMAEGLLAEWLVTPGDEVEAGQILFVVETDKISNEVEAPAPGRILSLLVAAGDTVEVGAPVAMWTGPGRAEAPVAEAMVVVASAVAPVPQANGAERIRSTPFARRLAKLGDIEIARIIGTGARGRLQARDVEARGAKAGTPGSGRNHRALIAARVSRSKAEIPHFYVTADARFDALHALRSDLNDDPQATRKLSVTALLAMAVTRALALVPEVNVAWRGDHTEPLSRIAIGVAVDTPGGVIAPVVAAAADIHSLADALDAAIGRARHGRIGAADVGEAAGGISTVGMFAVRALIPIIDPDQTFMLGIGAPQPVFRPGPDGAPRAVREVTLSLACDHRAVDGAGAARFLATIVTLIEHPARLLMPQRQA